MELSELPSKTLIDDLNKICGDHTSKGDWFIAETCRKAASIIEYLEIRESQRIRFDGLKPLVSNINKILPCSRCRKQIGQYDVELGDTKYYCSDDCFSNRNYSESNPVIVVPPTPNEPTEFRTVEEKFIDMNPKTRYTCANCNKETPNIFMMRYSPSKEKSVYFCNQICHDTFTYKSKVEEETKCDNCQTKLEGSSWFRTQIGNEGPMKYFCNMICKENYVKNGPGRSSNIDDTIKLLESKENTTTPYSEYDYCSQCNTKFKDYNKIYAFGKRFCDDNCKLKWQEANPNWMNEEHYAYDCNSQCPKHKEPEIPEAVMEDALTI